MAAPCHKPAWVRQQTLALSRLPHAHWSPGGWLITVILKLQSWWAGAFYKKKLLQKWVRLGLNFFSERNRQEEKETDFYWSNKQSWPTGWEIINVWEVIDLLCTSKKLANTIKCEYTQASLKQYISIVTKHTNTWIWMYIKSNKW